MSVVCVKGVSVVFTKSVCFKGVNVCVLNVC